MLEHIFRRLQSLRPVPLGRWCTKDKTKNNWKIDMANTDHCGTCSFEKYVPKVKESPTSLPKEKVQIPPLP